VTRSGSTRRVVVTGMGLTSPIGNDPDTLAASLRAMKHGIRFMPEWSIIKDLQCRLGGNVDDLDLDKTYPRKKRRGMGKVALLAVYATERAIEHAKLPVEVIQSGRCGVAYGSTSGSNSALVEFCGPLFTYFTMKGLDPSAYLKFMAHTCAANLASFFGVKGRIIPTNSACTSASQSIGYAYESIKHGMADVMMCGGAEEQHYASAVTFDLLMATSIRYNSTPDLSPRPFDSKRDGLVIGEGAGTLILESEEHAKARGATILCELAGYGTNCDGGHLTAPSRDGMKGAIALSIADAGVDRDRIGYVNAHATGTDVGDIEESHATYEVFERAVPISSIKSYMGHTLGACGAIESIASIRMLTDGFLAANRNLDEVDPRCAKLGYVRETEQAKLDVVMSNNFAFGGVNTSLIFRRYDA
jgi:3-oxoacyl-[acyl-carrier-protein] synthase II